MNDTSLWNQLQQGQQEAFNQIFRSYYVDLKAYGIKISHNEELAKEAIQILFVKIWERREQLGVVNSIKAYLLRAYRRNLIDLLEAEQKRRRQTYPQAAFHISPEELSIYRDQQQAQAKQITALLNRLPDKQKEIIYLRFYNQLSYIEIAEILDLNYQTVRNYGVKAMKFLAKEWEE